MTVPGKISVVLPYWERPQALCDGLFSLSKHYRNDSDQRDDLEVVVVDDGSPTKPARPVVMSADLGFVVKLVELPIKQGPLNPCVPINRGVERANGEFICLSNPEIVHRSPLLWEMRDTIRKLGPKTYVSALVWGLQSDSWHSHPVHASAFYHFLTMCRRDLFIAANGFDERFRDGYCFDDPSFVQRMIEAGAQFTWREDLIADHPQYGDSKHTQPRELWDRNHDLFWSIYPNPKSYDGKQFTNATLQNWPQYA